MQNKPSRRPSCDMKTILIKNKEYVPVVERVKEFHRLYPLGEISTEIIGDGIGRIVIKATIKIPAVAKITQLDKQLKETEKEYIKEMPPRCFTGHSQAEWGKGMMGDVALEIAETSAIGRALGFANIGLLDGIASADEMRKVSKKSDGKNINETEDEPF